jgi:hypothetical protein
VNTDIDGSQIVILSKEEAQAALWALLYLNDRNELGHTQYLLGKKLINQLGLSSDLLKVAP